MGVSQVVNVSRRRWRWSQERLQPGSTQFLSMACQKYSKYLQYALYSVLAPSQHGHLFALHCTEPSHLWWLFLLDAADGEAQQPDGVSCIHWVLK